MKDDLPTFTPRIYLRRDQTSEKYKNVSNPGVTIFAPKWVEEALKTLEPQLLGISFEVRESSNTVLDVITLKDHISLTDLHKISRNEPKNVTGIIRLENYNPSVSTNVILTLKDLIRQCAVVGIDRTIGYGGFGPRGYRSEHVEQSSKVYVCDLIGLQFKKPGNSGRLVLVAPEGTPFPQGVLDDFIFQQVVGEKKSSYGEAEADSSGRYIPFNYRRHGKIFFDTHAYKRFITNDVILCGIALETVANQQADKDKLEDLLNFKFLKYGTGFFAGPFTDITTDNILPAVIDGLEELFKIHHPRHIKAVEFPFYTPTPADVDRLEKLKATYGLEYRFSTDDALKDSVVGLVTATTNCADPHAATGNEMGFSSVDSAIASNLESKGNIFCPLLNPDINSLYVTLHTKLSL